MAPAEIPQTKVVPLTCHGHSRPITHLSFSGITDDEQYYLITACKDNNPILRSGTTGDWIGTFLGHKGAVWSARLSHSASLAATGSADFSAKVWDTHTGGALHTLQHNHIVRAVAFPTGETHPKLLATGGAEKKLRLWDLNAPHSSTNGNGGSTTTDSSGASAVEIAPGSHTSTIKSILFAPDSPHTLVTASEDKTLRWFDIRAPTAPLASYTIPTPTGVLGSCELSMDAASPADSIISVAAGRCVSFLSGSAARPANLIKSYNLDRDCSAVALNLNPQSLSAGRAVAAATVGMSSPLSPGSVLSGGTAADRRFITASKDTTWVHVHDWNTGEELEVGKGHHGPVWSTAYSPDGRLYATGSEDGTVKLWKAVEGSWGLWR